MLTTHKRFKILIVTTLLLNLILLTTEHYGQTKVFTAVQSYSNAVFVIIYIVEFILKMIGFGLNYFRSCWNVFDFSLVVVSIIGRLCNNIILLLF